MPTHTSLEQAFRTAPRELFLPDAVVKDAFIDAPLPIGFGQTNSQPSTVYSMLEWLVVEPGNAILDVGSGSGWTAALLSMLTGKTGHVTALEVIPELVTFGKKNCQKLKLQNVSFTQALPHKYGYTKDAPYDRILVSAAATTVPNELLAQLTNRGIMVIPVHNTILEIEKHGTTYETTEHPGYVFVPLI